MRVYRCDRCGRVYDKPPVKSITVSMWDYDTNKWTPYDICSICRDELREWWKKK